MTALIRRLRTVLLRKRTPIAARRVVAQESGAAKRDGARRDPDGSAEEAKLPTRV